MAEQIVEKPRWERRKQSRPQELTAAALELFVERGYAATRLEDIAARAGVSKGTVYLYFANKEELFKAVVRESIVPAIAQGERVVSEHPGPASDILRYFLRGWWQMFGETSLGGINKLLVSEARNFPEIGRFYSEEVIGPGHALVARVLKRGIDAGEFRPGDPETLIQLVFAPLLMRVIWKHSLDCCEASLPAPDQYIEAVIEFVLRGLSADRGGSPCFQT
jgi:AcrR family transcriptional regulator